jgi:hypothetical protein
MTCEPQDIRSRTPGKCLTNWDRGSNTLVFRMLNAKGALLLNRQALGREEFSRRPIVESPNAFLLKNGSKVKP